MNEVYISIKSDYTKLIESREKNYEFRTYLMKNIKTMYVYESGTSQMKYIMDVGEPISSINKIEENGIGNKEFNDSETLKYAYPIIHLKKLTKPITLTELKSKYKFLAPQKFIYVEKYPKLKEIIDKSEYKIIF